MRLSVEGLSLGYRARPVVEDISLTVRTGELVAVIGPNGSGKSTLLRGIGRLLRPTAGRVLLDGDDIQRLSPRTLAKQLALLPQTPEAGVDLTVEELAWRGRHPHRSILRGASRADHEAVAFALTAADLLDLRGRQLGSLSGGERQRAWIALALAQQPQVLLLDEPTSFLDVRHQVEVMELLRRQNADGLTVVAVLHDLQLAARYADRVVALRDGRVALDGPPREVFTAPELESVFDTPMQVLIDPESGQPVPLPRAPQSSPQRAAGRGASS